ncbi:hypothetical protein PCANC_26331 [Puccinia coronata f. sp. avenae]|uniref:Uncharacterized protein n=1 Tax=Puccinia coronata f. sp. avenae TaxID=200324 RepID=A0A2N5TNP0_9BASI|nr:hypothetical protein PCANC_26331 [Puccinia coronata f. sp. avenae]
MRQIKHASAKTNNLGIPAKLNVCSFDLAERRQNQRTSDPLNSTQIHRDHPRSCVTMPKASKSTGTEKFQKNGRRNQGREAADEDYEQVFQLAVKQEEQGERYQFGAKAKRNYEQSIQSYRLSIDLLTKNPSDRSPSDGFNSHFNLARVLVHFGTTFASAPSDCVRFVQLGINEYQRAIQYAIKDSNQSDEIDARYNLALGMSTMAEMLSAGARLEPGFDIRPDDHSTAIQIWKQAKEELSRAYQLQESLLANSPNLGLSGLGDNPADQTSQSIDDLATQPASPTNAQTTLVEEVFVITPSVLIDTLLDICEVLLFIYPFDPDSVSIELCHYVQQLQAVNQKIESSLEPNFSRQFEIDSLICTVELTKMEHTLSESITNIDGSPSVMAEMGEKMYMVNQKLEELSQDSIALDQDFLKLLGLAENYSSLSSVTCSLITIRSKIAQATTPDDEINALKFLIEKTMSLYSLIIGKLKRSKLRPIKQIKPHEVSSYISSSLVGQSELALMVELLDQQPGRQPFSQTQTNSFDLAIEAYNQSLGAYTLSRDSTTNSFLLAFSSVHQHRSTHEKEDRNEWSNFSARLEAIKWLLRCKFHHRSRGYNPLNLDQIVKDEISPLIAKFEIYKNDLMRFYEDFQDDPVFLLSNSIEKPLFDLLLAPHGQNN